jgi:hypothetical protein
MGVQGMQEEDRHSRPQESSYVERKEKIAEGLYVMINDYLMAFYHVQQLLRTE